VHVCVLTGRSSSSLLFSDESMLDAERTAALNRRSDRSSAASVDRQSTSSSDHSSLFRLPYPKPAHRSSSMGSAAAAGAQSVYSPPLRTATRFDFCSHLSFCL